MRVYWSLVISLVHGSYVCGVYSHTSNVAVKARMRKKSLDWMLEMGAIYLEEKLEVNSHPKETTGTKWRRAGEQGQVGYVGTATQHWQRVRQNSPKPSWLMSFVSVTNALTHGDRPSNVLKNTNSSSSQQEKRSRTIQRVKKIIKIDSFISFEFSKCPWRKACRIK